MIISTGEPGPNPSRTPRFCPAHTRRPCWHPGNVEDLQCTSSRSEEGRWTDSQKVHPLLDPEESGVSLFIQSRLTKGQETHLVTAMSSTLGTSFRSPLLLNRRSGRKSKSGGRGEQESGG